MAFSDMNTNINPVTASGLLPVIKQPDKQINFVTTVTLALLVCSNAIASPQGGTIVAGEGSIRQSDWNTTLIQQRSSALAIDWRSFNVAVDEVVRFEQPNSSATALNRIQQQSPSEILGSIQANGQVWLINPNGIIFGADAQINVGALLAGSLDINVNDFMQGQYAFEVQGQYPPGVIINKGLIQAASGGSVTLMGSEVYNQGLIEAHHGRVNMVAADRVNLDFDGDGLIQLQIDEASLDNLIHNTAVDNSGVISAHGGEVLLSTSTSRDLFTSLVNNSGTIVANRIDNSGGVIRLLADGGSTHHSGALDASAGDHLSSGGRIELLGEAVRLEKNATVTADALGQGNGGTVLIGGDYQGENPAIETANYTDVASSAHISANAGSDGDGGKVIVWADNTTRFAGNISARGGSNSGNGGLVEISGKQQLMLAGQVNTSAPNGDTGTLLIDPLSLTIIDAVANDKHHDDNGENDEYDSDYNNYWSTIDSNVISWGTIDSFASDTNIILQTIGDITIEDITGAAGGDITAENLAMLDLDNGSLSLISHCGSVIFADSNDIIRTEGGAIKIYANGGDIIAGGFDTTGVNGTTSGNVLLSALQDISVNSIHTGNATASLQVDNENQKTASLQITGDISGNTVTLRGGIDSNGDSDDTLMAANGLNQWQIDGPNSGTLNNMQFENFANLMGGTQVDSFTLQGGSLSGQLNGGGGMDILQGSDNYQITGLNSGHILGQDDSALVFFQNIESLTGSAGADRFVFSNYNAAVSGTINGGANLDTLDYSNYIEPQSGTELNSSQRAAQTQGITINLTSNSATATGGIAGIEALIGSAGTEDTLIGPNNTNNEWQIRSIDPWGSGNRDGGILNNWFYFTDIENLTGSNGSDQFIFYNDVSIAGLVDGGGGTDIINYENWAPPIVVNFKTNTATGTGGIRSIEQVRPDHDVEPQPWDVLEQTYIDDDTSDEITPDNGSIEEKKRILKHLAQLLNRPEIRKMSPDVLRLDDGRYDAKFRFVISLRNQDDWLDEIQKLKKGQLRVENQQWPLLAMGDTAPGGGTLSDASPRGLFNNHITLAAKTGPQSGHKPSPETNQYVIDESTDEGGLLATFVDSFLGAVQRTVTVILPQSQALVIQKKTIRETSAPRLRGGKARDQ